MDSAFAMTIGSAKGVVIFTQIDGVIESGKAALEKGDHHAKTATYVYS